MRTDIKSLESILTVAFDHELARLRKLASIVDTRRTALNQLSLARTARAQEITTEPEDTDFAFRAGQDGKWQAWCREERARLTRELAVAMADYEAQRLVAKHTFGRLEAIGELSLKEAVATADAVARRTAAENLI